MNPTKARQSAENNLKKNDKETMQKSRSIQAR